MKQIKNLFNSNYIKFLLSQLIRQPLILAYIVMLFTIGTLVFFSSLHTLDGRVIGLQILFFSFDEPFIINSIITSFSGFFLWIIFLFIILTTNKFWMDLINSPLLDILITKFGGKRPIAYSGLLCLLLVFFTPFLGVCLIYLVFFMVSGLTVIINVLTILFYYMILVLFTIPLSFFLIQVFDEFFASFSLIILYFLSSYFSTLNSNYDLSFLIKIILPFQNIISLIIDNLTSNFIFDSYFLFSMIFAFCVFHIAVKRFEIER